MRVEIGGSPAQAETEPGVDPAVSAGEEETTVQQPAEKNEHGEDLRRSSTPPRPDASPGDSTHQARVQPLPYAVRSRTPPRPEAGGATGMAATRKVRAVARIVQRAGTPPRGAARLQATATESEQSGGQAEERRSTPQDASRLPRLKRVGAATQPAVRAATPPRPQRSEATPATASAALSDPPPQPERVSLRAAGRLAVAAQNPRVRARVVQPRPDAPTQPEPQP